MRVGEDTVIAECQPELQMPQLSQLVTWGDFTIDGQPREYIPQVGTGMCAIIITYLFIKLINKWFA